MKENSEAAILRDIKFLLTRTRISSNPGAITIKVTPFIYALTHFLYPSWHPPQIDCIHLPKDMAEVILYLDRQKHHHKFLLAWMNLNRDCRGREAKQT